MIILDPVVGLFAEVSLGSSGLLGISDLLRMHICQELETAIRPGSFLLSRAVSSELLPVISIPICIYLPCYE